MTANGLQRGIVVLAALMALAAGAVFAQDAPSPALEPAAAADEVVRAVREGGDVAALVRRPAPDPWLVAVELLARGERESATAFAAAAGEPATRGLGRYVAGSTAEPAALRGALDALATAHRRLAERDAAGAREAAEALSVEDPVIRVEVASVLYRALHTLGDLAAAAPRVESAGELAESIGWLRRAAEAWTGAANARINMKQPAATAGHLRRKRQILLALDDRPTAALTLANLGVLNKMGGSYDAAVANFRASMEELEAVSPELLSGPAGVHLRYELGSALLHAERADEAEPELARAIEVATAAGHAAWVRKLTVLWGWALTSVGRSERAIEVLEACIAQTAPASTDAAARLDRAQALAHLAVAQRWSERPVEAEENLRRAALEFSAMGRVEDADRAMYAAADAALESGRTDQARSTTEPLLARFRDRGEERAVAAAECLLAKAAMIQGRFDAALEHIARSRTAKVSEGNEAQVANALMLETAALVRTGRAADATACALEWVARSRRRALRLSESAAFSWRTMWRDADVLPLAPFAANDLEALLHIQETRRAQVLLDALTDRRALEGVDADPRLTQAVASADRRTSDALTAYRDALDVGALTETNLAWQAYESARTASEEALLRLREDQRRRSVVEPPDPATIADVQAALAGNEAYVSYDLLETQYGDDIAYAIVFHGHAPPRRVDLGSASGLAALSVAPATPESMAALRAAAWTPLGLTDSVRRVYVSPSGALHAAPLDEVFAGPEVVLEPSATVWLQLRANEAAAGTGILGVGDPAYQGPVVRGDGSRASRDGIRLARLPSTAREVKAVSDVALLGEAATETAFRRKLAQGPPSGAARWRAVHIACHGLCDELHPLRSSLALLADAEHDGFLTAQEVFGLRVDADLALLSACSAGSGRVVHGEGLAGFAVAFLAAGTPRVIVNWNEIDDEATQAFMVAFHAAWRRDGTSTISALRTARNAVRAAERWRDPRYWAGWRLWGLP